MAGNILGAREQALLERARHLLQRMKDFLAGFEKNAGHHSLLDEIGTSLDELFMVVIVGEFNAGKSTFINALLHAEVLKKGVRETTNKITKVRYGNTSRQVAELNQDIVIQYYPADFLREMTIIDTPGTNTVWHEQIRLTEDFIPRSDLILFMMRAQQPFTQTERQFLEQIHQWGKKVVIVLNIIDMVTSEELTEVIGDIREKCQRFLGLQPQIFPVSSLKALQATQTSGVEAEVLRQASGFDALEDFLFTSLSSAEKVRLKLLAPLGVVHKLLSDAQTTVNERNRLLDEDRRGIEGIDSYLKQWNADMQANTESRIGNIEKIVLAMGHRGIIFIDRNIRIMRTFYLTNREQVIADFKSEVIGDSEQQIEENIQDLVDWQARQHQHAWQSIVEYAAQRLKVTASAQDQLVGSIATRFDDNRQSLLREMLAQARAVLNHFDVGFDAIVKAMADELQTAVSTAMTLSVGGVVVGTISTLIGLAVGSLVVDVTGIIAGILIVATGLVVIPVQHHRARRKFQIGIEDICRTLRQALDTSVQKEQRTVIERIGETIRPYTFFIKKEREFMQSMKEQLVSLESEARDLRSAIETEL